MSIGVIPLALHMLIIWDRAYNMLDQSFALGMPMSAQKSSAANCLRVESFRLNFSMEIQIPTTKAETCLLHVPMEPAFNIAAPLSIKGIICNNPRRSSGTLFLNSIALTPSRSWWRWVFGTTRDDNISPSSDACCNINVNVRALPLGQGIWASS